MSLHLMPLRLGDTTVAIEARSIREVLGGSDWIAIPGASAELPGVLAWQGRAIAILDLGGMLGTRVPFKVGDRSERFLVAHADGCTFAIPVNFVREVREVSEYRLPSLRANERAYAQREVDLDGLPVPVIDLDGLVRQVRGQGE